MGALPGRSQGAYLLFSEQTWRIVVERAWEAHTSAQKAHSERFWIWSSLTIPKATPHEGGRVWALSPVPFHTAS